MVFEHTSSPQPPSGGGDPLWLDGALRWVLYRVPSRPSIQPAQSSSRFKGEKGHHPPISPDFMLQKIYFREDQLRSQSFFL